ncbi:MAG: alpha/beta fold hydrolase [Leptospiraceae bacterium]|nr:alpha/beta fold hydrolase [Leptospiraceae bacterium]
MGLIPFQPTIYGRGQHFQTISAQLLSKWPGYMPRKLGLLNERAVLPTDDQTGDSILIHIHRFIEDHGHTKPAVVLVHGLEGDASSIYIVKLADRLLRAGFNVVRVDQRTCGQGRGIARNAYYSGLTIDLATVLRYTRRYLADHVALVGISLGANLTLKVLGEDHWERRRQIEAMGGQPIKGLKQKNRRLADAFIAISPPLELERSCEILDGPNCRLYRNMFLKSIMERARAGLFRVARDPREVAARLKFVKTFFDFDHQFTAPHAGFDGAIQYYRQCGSRPYVPYIDVPGLILHAEDDPLIHMSGWHECDFASVPWITPELTHFGGHVGWIARRHPLFEDRRWMDYRVAHYLSEWRDNL